MLLVVIVISFEEKQNIIYGKAILLGEPRSTWYV